MDKDTYATALSDTLTEVRNICSDISCSFIFTKEGSIVAGDEQSVDVPIEKTVNAFQNLMEKAITIGGLYTMIVNGSKGNVHISSVNDMYLVIAASKNADMVYIHSIANVIVPTVLKLLKSIAPTPPTPLKKVPSQQLVVENISGFFVGDTVQVDEEILRQWSKIFKGKNVREVEVEVFGGKVTQCKVKAISDSQYEGKGLIRVPEKIARELEVTEGELVRIKPVKP
jgi:predicted regulator of Ras-like GTPase activity (Roadblock/LC7/MglB family)